MHVRPTTYKNFYIYLYIKITAYPCSKKYSAERDPLVPALKLSTNLTVLCSRGIVVPPLCNIKKLQSLELGVYLILSIIIV